MDDDSKKISSGHFLHISRVPKSLNVIGLRTLFKKNGCTPLLVKIICKYEKPYNEAIVEVSSLNQASNLIEKLTKKPPFYMIVSIADKSYTTKFSLESIMKNVEIAKSIEIPD